MASPVGTLRVDLGANTAQFAAGMDAARSKILQFQSAGAKAASGAGRLGGTVANMSKGFSNSRFAVQNAAFQVGDFAVQVAGGTSAVRAMSQQMPQLLGAFGLFGALAGAAFAIFAPLVGKLFEGGEAADGFAKALKDVSPSLEGIRGQISTLGDLQQRYTDAIRASGGASTGAAALIAANSKREFEARKSVLAVELELLRIRAQEQSEALRNLKDQQRIMLERTVQTRENMSAPVRSVTDAAGFAYTGPRTVSDVLGADVVADADRNRLAIQKTSAELDLLRLAADEAGEALNTTFKDIGGAAGEGGVTGGGGGGGGGGGSGARKEIDATKKSVDELNTGIMNLGDAAQGMKADFGNAFTSIITGAKSAKEALADLLASFASKLANSAFDSLWGAIFPGGLGFGGARAMGGPVSPRNWHIVGENGPEVFVPSTSGMIVPNHALGGGGAGGMVFNIDARGAQEGVASQIRRELEAFAPRIVNASVSAVSNARLRGKPV